MWDDGFSKTISADEGGGAAQSSGFPEIRVRRGLRALVERFTAWHWVLLYSLVLGSWIALFALSVPIWAWTGAGVYGIEFWLSLCQVDPSSAGFPTLFAMWLAMSAAMMMPTFFPVLVTYEDLGATGAASGAGFVKLALGFVSPWLVYAAVAASIQFELGAILRTEQGSWIWAAALLACAGVYQFASPKQALLARCRSPLPIFVANWRSDPFNEFRLGARFGLMCVGCCWLLMAISLVAGAMNLLWMGLATIVMILEKLPRAGHFVTKPLAFALIAAAFWQAVANIN